MGIMVSRDEEKTELDKRINADLRARAQSSARHDPDGVEDSAYVKDLQKTSRFGWVWIVLIVLAILSLIFIVIL